MLRELLRYRSLIKNLVFKDLKLKFRDSFLGVVWSLLNPALMLVVYTFAFKVILRVQTENYAYFLMVGLLTWNFFAVSIQASTQAVVGNAHLVRTVYFPREALPIATVLFAFAQLLLAFVVFLPALGFVSNLRFSWTVILLVPLLVLHLLFTVGLAFVFAASTVFFRDVTHLTEVLLPILFWITPIIYPVSMAPSGLQQWFKVSPLAAFAIAYQDVLFWGRLPEHAVALALLAWTAVALLVGLAVFRRTNRTFAEEI
jgi:homopolymeric O-antigen transport system permease protein